MAQRRRVVAGRWAASPVPQTPGHTARRWPSCRALAVRRWQSRGSTSTGRPARVRRRGGGAPSL